MERVRKVAARCAIPREAVWDRVRRGEFDAYRAPGGSTGSDWWLAACPRPPHPEGTIHCPQAQRQTHNGHVSDAGGDRAAIIYTVAETAKLNGLDPEAYIAAVLARLARGHTIDRLDDLLPWNFTPAAPPAGIG
jgi:hypothetical protein